MKMKILHVAEVEVIDDQHRHCLRTCEFYCDDEGPSYCNAFREALRVDGPCVIRSHRCVVAAGNHNIFAKCLAGE